MLLLTHTVSCDELVFNTTQRFCGYRLIGNVYSRAINRKLNVTRSLFGMEARRGLAMW